MSLRLPGRRDPGASELKRRDKPEKSLKPKVKDNTDVKNSKDYYSATVDNSDAP